MTHGLDQARSLSTRRGFVATASLGILGLYGVWTVLGASGGNKKDEHEDLGGHGGGAPENVPLDAGGHTGHGAASQGPSVDEFRNMTEAFVQRWKQPDGSVRPGKLFEPVPQDAHAGHGAHASQEPPQTSAAHAGHGETASGAVEEERDVYLMAYQWAFEPSWLKLDVGKTYRLRMMAVDASHGASIQMGNGSLITRLRQGVLTEREITFTAPGKHLLYCTVFCGAFHDRMTARIDVG